MTLQTTMTPFDASEPPGPDEQRRKLIAFATAMPAAASLAYAMYLMIAIGWLGTAKTWLAWPTYTWLNIAATMFTFISAWIAKREFEQTEGRLRIQNAAVFIVSAALCIAFLLGLLVALVILRLSALNNSDDDSNSDFRPRRGRHRRRRPQHRSRSRSRRGRSGSRTRRRRNW